MKSLIAKNRKAFHNYQILEKIEAGISLLGSEVKAIREGRVSLSDSFGKIDKKEIFLHNIYVGPYSHSQAGREERDLRRKRKLLLHKSQIKYLAGKVIERGWTLIPLSLYFKRGRVKVELALAKGKRQYDKREVIRKREIEREIRRLKK